MTEQAEIEYLKEQVDFLSRNYVTGLHGRHIFMKKLSRLFGMEPFYIVMYDVDGLHEVNRLKGYSVGDALLKSVANDLEMCDAPCSAYHIGGDEFYVIYLEEPTDIDVANTTYAKVSSIDYESIQDMLDEVDKRVALKKSLDKKRRRDDV